MASATLSLRPAEEADRRLLYEWANDPDVRASGFHPEPIPWETHVRWFAARLADPDSHLFIAELAGDPVGQIRLEVSSGVAEVHVSLDRDARHRGLAPPLIQLGCEALARDGRVAEFRARVRADNAASLRSFRSAGFQRVGEERIRGQSALALQRKEASRLPSPGSRRRT